MTLSPPDGVSLRPYLPQDTDQISELIRDSIIELASEDYSGDQCEAWAARFADCEGLTKKLTTSVTLLAEHDKEIAGLITLKDNQLIDLLFVSPHFAGRGVATFLCKAIELLAAGRKSSKLLVDASDTALPLFTKLGFMPERRNTIAMNGQWLANTTMQKQLNPNSAPATSQ